MSDAILYTDTLPGGKHWSMRMRRGTSLKLIDVEGGANVGMLFYNPENRLERYNAPDTLKGQHTFKITQGHCLYSDMGRIFCSVTADSLGWHDTVCGNSNSALVTKKWGKQDYQHDRNDWLQNGTNAFLVEAAKYGLTKKDLAANLNLFSAVIPDDDGNLQYQVEHSKAGDFIELRFEMDTIVLLHTCPHPLNPASTYPFKPVEYQLLTSAPVADDDACKNACAENQRGFENNRLYHLGV
ncbi:urea amidolyase associated protein UAAP1 [Shewanella saliphila]|uniref:Urea carboxylase n=1 Tax=Shewanella saliphila TaxID=2282698 RepID=A0ABQ2QCL5_9GAMM|nr:urea amidolyase associated protein UAAP1 [Shewanella saliphila]MCL1103369.1 urea carboxylase-associated family protein [Shewanella saliphila]GGP68956.1 urea carboxylase [Shewanella saliphila]